MTCEHSRKSNCFVRSAQAAKDRTKIGILSDANFISQVSADVPQISRTENQILVLGGEGVTYQVSCRASSPHYSLAHAIKLLVLSK